MIDFKDVRYLQNGNDRQKRLFEILSGYQIMEHLNDYKPILVGTIPIHIDIEESDVDIILETRNLIELEQLLRIHFSRYDSFRVQLIQGVVLLCCFNLEGFPFELYATNIHTEKQNAYLHMLKEYQILQDKGEAFRLQIKKIKRSGIKTELAFCKLLQIEGDPYLALLEYEEN